jgi:hypothetical protein
MYSEQSSFPHQEVNQTPNNPEVESWENNLLNILAKKTPETNIQGFNCAQWLRCKEIYANMKDPNSPPDHIEFGTAGSGNTIWSLFKTTDQNIYLIEFSQNNGLFLRRYEKLSDESMVEYR